MKWKQLPAGHLCKKDVRRMNIQRLDQREKLLGVPKLLRGGAMTTPFVGLSTYEVPLSLLPGKKPVPLLARKLVLRASCHIAAGTPIAVAASDAGLSAFSLPDEPSSRFAPTMQDIGGVLNLAPGPELEHAALAIHAAIELDLGELSTAKWIKATCDSTRVHYEIAKNNSKRHMLGNEKALEETVERMRDLLLTNLEYGVVPTQTSLLEAWSLVSSCSVHLQPPSVADDTESAEVSAPPAACLGIVPVMGLMANVACTTPNVELFQAHHKDVLQLASVETGGHYMDGTAEVKRSAKKAIESTDYMVLVTSSDVEVGSVLALGQGMQVDLPVQDIDEQQFVLGLR